MLLKSELTRTVRPPTAIAIGSTTAPPPHSLRPVVPMGQSLKQDERQWCKERLVDTNIFMRIMEKKNEVTATPIHLSSVFLFERTYRGVVVKQIVVGVDERPIPTIGIVTIGSGILSIS